MEPLQSFKTLTGIKYDFTGSLSSGLVIYKKNYSVPISKQMIDIIRKEIQTNSPILMGANRDKPNTYSIGHVLKNIEGGNPQFLSYVVPLLVEEGFCKVNNKKPFILTIV